MVMAIKLGRVVTYRERLPLIKLDNLDNWSCMVA